MEHMTEQRMKTQPPRTVLVDDIVGMVEIGQRLGGVSAQVVWNWTRRYDFPAPIARVSNKPVWDWTDVNDWNKNWVRSRGGFPTHKAQQNGASK